MIGRYNPPEGWYLIAAERESMARQEARRIQASLTAFGRAMSEAMTGMADAFARTVVPLRRFADVLQQPTERSS
jgi:hypothetical protein